jgi:hypothetical protein
MADIPKDPVSKSINIDYIKANDFRVLHADGAFMAGTANGLTLSLYSERQPIPRRVVHEVGPNYELGKEITDQRVVREAVIRDVPVTFSMNLEVAKNLAKTLNEVLEQIERVKEKARESSSRRSA